VEGALRQVAAHEESERRIVKLIQTDIDFILAQLRLPGNRPLNPLDPTGIRDVQGIGNNVENPSWGAADTLFPRLSAPDFTYSEQQGAFTASFSPLAGISNVTYSDTAAVNYAVRDTTVVDATPRIISNLVAETPDRANPEYAHLTQQQIDQMVLDDPAGRVNPLTGAINPLPYSSVMAFFGQFFDHGLDFVHKGADGQVIVPLLPGDPLYKQAVPGAPNLNFMMADRTNTATVDIGEGSADALVRQLGLAEGNSFAAVTGGTAITGPLDGGNLVLNGKLVSIAAGATAAQAIAQINAQSAMTGVTASLDAGRLVLTPAAGESFNTVSPFIDLSQSYGSAPSHTVFLREYAVGANGAAVITGRLVSGGADGNGMASWADIKANAAKLGITLHDYNVTDIPLVRINADGSFLNPQTGRAQLVALDRTTGQVVYVQDTDKLALARDNLVLMTTGHAFLDDIAHGAMRGMNANGDLADPTLLNAHLVAGDGRTNENIALTAIHDVFHAEHNRMLADIKAMVLGGLDSHGRNWDPRQDAGTWTGEDFFQAAKLVTEMEYQHLVFGEFARTLSPNIGAFGAYDVTIDPAVTAEFAHAVYRFGHSMMRDEVAMTEVGPDGLAVRSPAGDNSVPLLKAFLNPTSYVEGTAAEVFAGSSMQVGNKIDEWVTDTLRNNLVGLPLDLATLNIVRGRDTGLPSLNEFRAQIHAQTNGGLLKPYESWGEFAMNLLHPESLQNFIAAYARDAILTTFGDNASLDYWNALQLSAPAAYAEALRAAAVAAMENGAFMAGENQDFNRIDLWLGGLAEKKVQGGMLGSTFDFVFARQMLALQNGDRFYYLERLVGTNILAEIEGQFFADIIMRNTGVQHLYPNVFAVPDATVEMTQLDPAQNTASSLLALQAADKAGWVPGIGGAPATFYGNPGDYTDGRGVANPNGFGNASEVIGGTAGADRINALGGNDAVYGDGGNDTIEGHFGNDFLRGGDGNDQVSDTEGDDFLWGDAGNDTVNGGVGIDQVFGGDGDDLLFGGLGDDVLDGMGGADTIYGDGPTATASDGADVVGGGDGDDLLFGGGGSDALDGAEGADTMVGGPGADAFIGGPGDDLVIMTAEDVGFNNAYDGTDGFDIVDYSLSQGQLRGGVRVGVDINLSNGGIAPPVVGLLPVDSFISVEGVVGSAFADTLTGGPAPQVDALGVPILVPDPVTGLPVTVPMNFYIDGGAGVDILTGGMGDDIYVVDSLADVVNEIDPVALTPLGGIDTIRSHITYSIAARADIENLTLLGSANLDATGNALANVITGNAGSNRLDGGAGADTMAGGLGDDVYIVDSAADVVTEALGAGVDLVRSAASFVLGANAENLTLTGNAGINGTGNALANIITGNGGGNQLNGGGGDDILIGAGGQDNLTGGNGADLFVFRTIGESGVGGGTRDVITDFSRAQGDRIDLSAIDAIAGGTWTEFTFIGTQAFSGLGQLRYVVNNNGNLTIEGNTTGGLAQDFEIRLNNVANLAAADFILNPNMISIAAVDAVRAEGTGASTPFTFAVSRAGDTASAASVGWSIAAAGGVALDDFAGQTSGQVQFAAGQANATLTIDVAGDAVVEANEGFTVTLAGPSAGSALGRATAAGTILNDDASVSLAATNATRAEGNAGTTQFTFTATRTGDLSTVQTVDWAVGGGVATPEDFGLAALPTGRVTFGVGQTTAVIAVGVAGDTAVELGEAFNVTLSNASAGLAIGTATAVGQILNDDSAVGIRALDAVKAEGNAGTTPFTFELTRTGDLSQTHTVAWTVSAAAAGGADAGDFSGPTSGVATFVPNATTATITINVVGDLLAERNEAFTVNVSALSAGLSVATASAGGTILDDDVIRGTAGADTLTGTPAANYFDGLAGNDSIDGAGGTDTALYDGTIDQYGFGMTPDGRLLVSGNGQVDTLFSIEQLQFGDAVPVLVSSLAAAGAMRDVFSVSQAGQQSFVLPDLYTGPVAGLQYQWLGSDGGENVVIGPQGTFLNLLGGNDAATGGDGNDVIDGGTGSNFLTGGAGRDVFFIDGRSGQSTWSTIADWQAGDQVTLWGWRPNVSASILVEAGGAPGYEGATLHADLDGNGFIDTSVTWAGIGIAALPQAVVVTAGADTGLWFG
jgi:Ca2+-binding RTX toxin-like protein